MHPLALKVVHCALMSLKVLNLSLIGLRFTNSASSGPESCELPLLRVEVMNRASNTLVPVRVPG